MSKEEKDKMLMEIDWMNDESNKEDNKEDSKEVNTDEVFSFTNNADNK